MALLLLDLDNTLVDRDAAFRSAAVDFLAEHGLPAEDLAWVLAEDASGYAGRAAVAGALAERYGDALSAAQIRAFLDHGASSRVVLAAAARAALTAARESGWSCVIVTNGRVVQQERKIRRTGLDGLVDGWVVSEGIGVRKPDPEIFRAAALRGGMSLAGAWMVGDSAHADIAGAGALGLSSVWVAAGRAWTEEAYRPTHTAPDVASAIGHVVASAAA
jgi:putative hydrolase of the HAD superfamily